MLTSAAARAVNGRGAPTAFRAASGLTAGRNYHTSNILSRSRTHLENRIYKPSQYSLARVVQPVSILSIRNASSGGGRRPPNEQPPPASSSSTEPRDSSSTHPEVEAAIRAATGNETKRNETGATAPKQDAAADIPHGQPEFESVAADVENAASRASVDPESDSHPTADTRSRLAQDSQRQNADNTWASQGPGEGQSPVGPLPDLRHGIPSTFESEFSDKSTSFKEREAEEPNLNLTEDPGAGGGRGSQDEGPREAYVSSIERRRLLFARYAYISAAAFLLTGALFLGQNWDEAEANQHPDAPNGWGPMQFYNRIRERLARQLGHYTEPAFQRLLPDMEPQYRMPYTLVLSLEDLLVHSQWSRSRGWELAKRPGVDYFLRYLSQYYELVIFTSVQSMNADPVIRKLDPYRVVAWPLFREATHYKNGEHVKDLAYLNRPLSKTVIIDTVPGHVQNQPENAIILPKWTGGPSDSHSKDLVALIPFLEYIATMAVDDVRNVLKSYEGQNIAVEFAAREARAREAFNKRLAEEQAGSGAAKRTASTSSGSAGQGLMGKLSGALGFKPSQGLMQAPGEPTPAEGFAQGKMLSDQIRERGQRHYQMIDRDIRENGDKWLEEMAREEKRAQEEAMKSMQSGVVGFPGKLFGGWLGGDGGGGGEGDGGKKS